VSRPQGIERERVGRTFGGSLRFLATQELTRTPDEHGQPRCNEYLRPTRFISTRGQPHGLPVVLYPYRRGTPGGCSRDFPDYSSRLGRGWPWRAKTSRRGARAAS
jgi:hypothetical protein